MSKGVYARTEENRIEMIGKTFGKWTVLSYSGKDKYYTHQWNCMCLCGATGVVGGVCLRNGKSKGCKVCGGIKTRPYEALYRRLLRAAKQNNYQEVMSYEEFLTFTSITECVYCGEKVIWSEYSKRDRPRPEYSRYNLDRKDNNLEYTKDNCVVCCKSCNWIKSDKFTYEQMLQIGALIKSWHI